jgi:hypothetical protein
MVSKEEEEQGDQHGICTLTSRSLNPFIVQSHTMTLLQSLQHELLAQGEGRDGTCWNGFMKGL